MIESSHVGATKRPRPSRFATTQTTLYELVETITNEVKKEEEKLVPKIISYLMNSRRIKLIKKA